MRARASLTAVLLVLIVAAPAFAAEDGLTEVSSVDHNDDFTHAVFAHTIINSTEYAIDVAPRDLTTPDYPILTLVEITAGTFDNGIWTVGTLEPGATAYIEYTGDTLAATTTGAESLPRTGPENHLAVIAVAGLALIGLGASILRTARD
ncbi:MAG: LPXTG cell wall anchor domain-containing protein [Actinomycetota bacterium]